MRLAQNDPIIHLNIREHVKIIPHDSYVRWLSLSKDAKSTKREGV
jgi:hypothetical protein